MKFMQFKCLYNPGLFACAVIVMLCCGGCAAGFHFENAEMDEDEDIAEAYSVLTEIGDGADAIEKEYLDDDGFVALGQVDGLLKEINEYAASLYEEGVITDYHYQSGDTCVYMQIDGWLSCLYDPPIEGVMSGGSEKPQIVTLESVHAPLMFALAGFRGPDDTARMIEENNPFFTFSENYDKDDVTIETIKRLPQNSIIIWSGHGVYNSEVGSALCLGGMTDSPTGKPSANYQSMMLLHREELQDKAILSTTSGGFCATSKFFEKYMPENALYGDVVYLGSCYSYYLATYDGYEDSRLVDSILGLGASVVLGNTYAVSPIYSYKMIDSFFEGLTAPIDNKAFRTVEEALAYAKEKNGKEDVINKSEVFAKCAEGEENFRLSDMVQNAQTEGANQTYSEYTVQGYYPDGGECTVTFSEAIVEERTATVREFAGGDGGLLGEFENSRVTFITLADTCEVTVPRNVYADRDPNYTVEDDAFYSQAIGEGAVFIVDENHFDLVWYGPNSGGLSNGKAGDSVWIGDLLALDTDQFDTDYCFIALEGLADGFPFDNSIDSSGLEADIDGSSVNKSLEDYNVAGKAQTIGSGSAHSLAVKSDGSLWAWGRNVYGQLGNGTTTTNERSPIRIMDNVVAASAGYNESFAIKDDASLWAWGFNFNGVLGDGTTVDRYIPVKIMDDVAMVDRSYVIKTDGSLWILGRDGSRDWVDDTIADDYSPLKIMDDVVAISSSNHSLAIKTDGSLWTWGDNFHGQLGDGTTTDRPTPIKVMDGVIAVSAGRHHSLAIRSDGSLWAWGYNYDGELGDGTAKERHKPVKIMGNVKVVSAGADFSVAVKTDGSLWTWGDNDIGQLGDGTTTNRSIPLKIMDNVATISARENHVIAVKTDGSLWTWGYNCDGQLGDGTKDWYRSVPLKVMDDVAIE